MQFRERRELAIVLACLAVSALWIDLGTIHRHHTSDSIVMVLVSLQAWTPLYWEQDRLGMLFPLLATPWSHPLANLLVQGALTTLAGLSCAFLLGWYTVGFRRGIAVGALAAIFLVGFCRFDQQFEHLIMLQQNAQALAIGLAGLLLLARWTRHGPIGWAVAGTSSIAAAHWVNPGLAFVLGPLLLVRGPCFRDLAQSLEASDAERELGGDAPSSPLFAPGHKELTGGWRGRVRPSRDEIVGLVAVGLSVVGCIALSRLAAEPKPYHFLPPRAWLACAVDMYRQLHVYFHHRWFSAVEITAALGLLSLAWPAGRCALRLSLPMVAGLLAVAAVQYAFMSGLDHVRLNHSARYVILPVLLWQAALLGFAAIQLGAVLRPTRLARALPASLAVAMLLVVATRHGLPSTVVVRAELDASLGRYSEEILAAECTHVTGDYWHVWPAVFHANLRLADARSSRRVWGIAERSRPTRPQWRAIPWTDTRIAEIVGDERQAAEFLARYGVPPAVERERRATIRVLSLSADWNAPPELAARSSERK
jgi:hypothetical protein